MARCRKRALLIVRTSILRFRLATGPATSPSSRHNAAARRRTACSFYGLVPLSPSSVVLLSRHAWRGGAVT